MFVLISAVANCFRPFMRLVVVPSVADQTLRRFSCSLASALLSPGSDESARSHASLSLFSPSLSCFHRIAFYAAAAVQRQAEAVISKSPWFGDNSVYLTVCWDVLVPQIGLQRSGIVTLVRQGEAAGTPACGVVAFPNAQSRVRPLARRSADQG